MKWQKQMFEHQCELEPEEDVLYKIIPGKDGWANFRRSVKRHFSISNKNPRARRYFKSTAAINFERTRHIRTYRFVIHPYSAFRQNWEFAMICVYIYALLVIPAYAAFVRDSPREKDSLGWISADMLHNCLCLLDLCINFSSGYVTRSKKEIVLKPWRIALHYLITTFIVDFLSSTPVDHLLRFSGVHWDPAKYFPIARIIKYYHIFTLGTYLYRLNEFMNIGIVLFQMLLLLIRTFYVAHLFACLHYLVAFLSLNYAEGEMYDTVWILSEDIIDKDFGLQYQKSFFRATSNLLSVGYGTGPPETKVDQIFTSVAGLTGNVLYILVIGLFLQWAHIFNASTAKYEEMTQQLHTYMRYKQLPMFLQKRLIEYYEFRFQKSYFQENEILNALSSQLRQEIILHSCRRLVENVSFFNNLPIALLLRIVVCLRPEIFLVNDVIVKASAPGDCMYFITSGTVAIYTSTGKEVCHLEDGAHFGEIALVMEDERRVASVVAVESCELYRLDRVDFKRAVSPYPDLVARIERIAEERMERTIQLDEKNRRAMRDQGRRGREAQGQEGHSPSPSVDTESVGD